MLEDFIMFGLYLLAANYVVWVVGPKLGNALVDHMYRQATEELRKREGKR